MCYSSIQSLNVEHKTQDRFLKPREAAALLGVCTDTVRRMLNSKALKGQRIGTGKRWRILESDVLAVKASQP